MTLQFIRHGKLVRVDHFAPDTMLLDWLRLNERATGTKEGCNEGDCGACTVVLGEVVDGKIAYKAVNACILFLGQVHGKELITVEDLAVGGKLNAVQQAMVDCHGSQCGFCTPGIVMSLHALSQSKDKVSRDDVTTALAGNLCRCTGYKPIVEAAMTAINGPHKERPDRTDPALLSAMKGDLFAGNETEFFAAPETAEALADLCAKYPGARIVSGATDVGLWVTKQFRAQKQIIYTGRALDFAQVAASEHGLSIGAGATYSAAFDALAELAPDLASVVHRIGSVQVRNSGTVGGNIANGSPIGDMPPMLIALGATLTLRQGTLERQLPLENFFVDYGKQDRKSGEIVWRIDLPKPKADQHFKAYKISKRFDQDISAVMGSFLFTLDGNRISDVRIAFGGMAATPKRAAQAEASLRGKTLAEAMAVRLADFNPISDMRASADYRRDVAQGLLTKALLELQGEKQTRVVA